jgi:anaerobic selenocysteine-containing dehydrogenase
MKKTESGFEPVGSDQVLDEIAEQLAAIIDRHGPRAVSTYMGTYANMGSIVTVPVMNAFFDAIGTGMRFAVATIDQPAKIIAPGLQGIWQAGSQCWDGADVSPFVGLNPSWR